LIHENGNSRDPREGVFEELELLPVDLQSSGGGEPGDVSARSGQVGHQTGAYGIVRQDHDDRDRPGGVPGRDHGRRGSRRDDINPQTHEVRRQVRKTVVVRIGKAILDDDILSLDPPQVTQAAHECVRPVLGRRSRRNSEIAAPVYRARRLPLGHERRGEDAGQGPDERSAADHWIRWSARPSTECGILSPSAFAVLRLIANSNFVGCSIGISAGLAPLRMRATCRPAAL